MYKYTCLYCQKQFTSYTKDRKYCSLHCAPNAPRIMPILNCLSCKSDFIFKRLDRPDNPSKYCSKQCRLDYERSSETLKNNYLKHVIKNDNGCWGWNGANRGNGYRALSYKNKPIPAHRASWIIHNGPIPKGMFVCHSCDFPPCSRPDHLFIGTARDNSRDMIKKGRHNRIKGNNHPWSKLKEEDILKIRQMLKEDMIQKDIADLFDVKHGTISKIKRNQRWSHLKDI